MNALNKFVITIKKFGLKDCFYTILKKLGYIHECPVTVLHNREVYFKNLSDEMQKKELADFYENAIGKKLNLDNPQTFSEKLQWLKFYDSTKQKADLSDKYLAPKLIEQKYKNRIKTVKLLGVWDKAEDIDFDALPQKFAIKCNHGSAMNIIVKDKSKLNINRVRKTLNGWLSLDFAYFTGMYEKHYTYIDRKIIAEEFIEEMDGNLHDYKFHCFMGEPKYIEFIGDRVTNTHIVHDSIYTLDWKLTNIHMNNDIPYKTAFKSPEKLDQMLSLAKDMSNGYSYVRVDFYYLNNEIYFGEMTFTPDSGMIKFNPPEADAEWGKMIELPE